MGRVVESPCFKGIRDEVNRIRVLISDLRLGTQYCYLVVLKKWVEFAKRRDGELADFKVKSVDNELPECLSQGEVNRILDTTESLKWRALFRLTYEAAMRQHEVLGLRMKHVKFDEFGAEVFVPSTKSQALWLRVIDSAPILQTWIEQHPNKHDREAYVFLGRKKGRPLTETAFYYMVQEVAKRAGVEKHVSPHILRHSRLRWLKKYGAKIGISDSVICKLYGRWTPKNAHRMLDRYGRIEPTEANELVLKAYGKLGDDEFTEQLTKPRVCPRCSKENDALSKYCRLCGMVLDREKAMQMTKEQEGIQELLGYLPLIKESLREKEQKEKGN